MTTIDLFAGPGGWDVAAQMLGIPGKGIEINRQAVRTARAAGHKRRFNDIRNIDPTEYMPKILIGSPPCQGFTLTGLGVVEIRSTFSIRASIRLQKVDLLKRCVHLLLKSVTMIALLLSLNLFTGSFRPGQK